MEYKVVPFVPSIDRNKNASLQSAEQLEEMIKNFSNQGWKYIRLESVSTYVRAETGCFGFGDKPGYTIHKQMAVFAK